MCFNCGRFTKTRNVGDSRYDLGTTSTHDRCEEFWLNKMESAKTFSKAIADEFLTYIVRAKLKQEIRQVKVVSKESVACATLDACCRRAGRGEDYVEGRSCEYKTNS